MIALSGHKLKQFLVVCFIVLSYEALSCQRHLYLKDDRSIFSLAGVVTCAQKGAATGQMRQSTFWTRAIGCGGEISVNECKSDLKMLRQRKTKFSIVT